MAKPVNFVRLDVAKFLLRVLKTPEQSRGEWVSGLAEALAENQRGLHPFADELFEEVEEFRESDRIRKNSAQKHSTDSVESKLSKDSSVSTTNKSGSQAIRQSKTNTLVAGATDPLKDEFEKARKLYPGSVRGLDTEWENFKAKHGKRTSEIVPLLLPAVERWIKYRAWAISQNVDFLPQWKNFKTWINGAHWEDEIPKETILK